jgi:hydroxymethylpyrimidine pyrophosphatase-like HAD family hydrolase
MVLHNGAVVYLEGERVAAHTPFAGEVQDRLVEVCRRHPQACSIFFSLERLDVMHLNPQAQQQIERFHLDVQPFEDVGQQFTKITSVAARREPLEALAAEVQPLAVETSFSLPTVFEVNQAGVDKGVGLQCLLELTGWGRERLVVAGDGENDLPLFPLARRVYCPAGSPEKIRELADVIVNVEKDGLLGAVLSGYASDGGF